MNKIASPFLYNVFDLSDYDEVVFETMRGCPFSCSYCFYGGGESKLRFFSLERIKKELLVIKRQGGPRSCEFTDSNFNLPQRLNELYPILREVNSDHYFTFRAEINPEFVTEKQIEIVFDLMDTEDKELFEGCIDTLRCLINEDNRDKIKNMPQIECVHKYLPKENGIMKMIYLDFFKKIL